jgi:hypothetical protein
MYDFTPLLSSKGGETLITRSHCMQFIGRDVGLRTVDGATHRGILHAATRDGIYVHPISRGTRTTRLARGTDVTTLNIDLLQNVPQSANDVKEAFFPFAFFPFFELSALWPWGWW